MAITSYIDESGKTLWRVYVNVRSKTDSSIRTQRKMAGIEDEETAMRAEMRLARECEREIQEREAQGGTWGAVAEAWEKSLLHDNNMGETTRIDYIAALRKYTTHWWNRPATAITRADVREIITQFQVDGRSNSFQSKMKNIVNRIFLYGFENNLIKGMNQSPAHGIHVARREEKKPEILTIAQIRMLLVEARRHKHPWYPIWTMALLTGMRSGELYAVQWADVDWDNNLLTVSKSFNCRFKCIKSTKNGEYRTVPISADLKKLLLTLRATANGRAFVLPRLRQWHRGYQATELRAFCLGVGLPSIRFHTLRACFATQLIRSGVPVIQIQKICGWKDLETMQRYIRMAGIEVEGVTEALKVLPPEEAFGQVVSMFATDPVAS